MASSSPEGKVRAEPTSEGKIRETQLRQIERKSYCGKHPKLCVNNICETCLIGICKQCEVDHKGHTLIKTNIDSTLLQKVSIQKLPSLLDTLQELEQATDGSPQKLTLCKEARQLVIDWRDGLRQIIDKDSESLLNEIDNEIEIQDKLQSDISSSVKACMVTTDEMMKLLSDCRKTNDTVELMDNLNASNSAITETREVLLKIDAAREPISIDDMLPMKYKLDKISMSLHELFTFNNLQETEHAAVVNDKSYQSSTRKGPRPSYTQMKAIGKKMEFGKYEVPQISHSNFINEDVLILYINWENDVFRFHVNTQQLHKFRCNKTISRMCTLDSDMHIVLEDEKNDVHALDSEFKVIATLPHASDREAYTPVNVCHLYGHIFLILEKTMNNNSNRLTQVSCTKGEFKIAKQQRINHPVYNDIFVSNPSTSQVYLSCYGSYMLVQMSSGDITTIRIDDHVKDTVSAICIDDNSTTILGDDGGRVHVIKDGKYWSKVLKIKNEKIKGLAIVGDKLIVCGTCLYVYK